jgi:glutamine cyclotransferase
MKYLFLICAVSLVACGNSGSRKRERVVPPVNYGYRVVASYPHDTGAYTQGLFWADGSLVESTGERGGSTLRRVNLETGAVTLRRALDDKYFAEGAALVGDRIYQLTWQEGKCFVHDPTTFERTGEFDYRGEGWGLTTDGENLYMSDGTPNITVRDPATFGVERTIIVRRDGRPLYNINELEWIKGRIWANVYSYSTHEIVIIDPADGRVEGVIDFEGIISRLTLTPQTDVMNGIAWDPATRRIWVTGKNWNKLFEIEIFKK